MKYSSKYKNARKILKYYLLNLAISVKIILRVNRIFFEYPTNYIVRMENTECVKQR